MITTLAIQLESWVQEEIAAQAHLATALSALEDAVLSGKGAPIGQAGRALEAELAGAPAREARRRALLGRMAAALGLAPQGMTLTRIAARLESEKIDTTRLAGLRAELRTTVAGVARCARRLAAVAHYHRGFLDELCRTLLDQSGDPSAGQLVDARG